MFLRTLKVFIKKFFYIFGIEIHKGTKRSSFIGALQQIKKVGFTPTMVIDVGASIGTFTRQCYRIFPDSRYLLVEPLKENREYLDKVTKTISKAEYVLAAATAESGKVTLNVHEDFVGSSIYLEKEINLDGVPRSVPAITLDDICRNRGIPGPYLIKVDVQGAELNVLSGAREVLNKTEYLILEVSLFQFVKGGPQLYDIITFMKSYGFVIYDILGGHYRPLDGALAQVDMVFVKEDGKFRKYHIYTTRKQREKLNEEMLRGRRDQKG